LKRWYRGISFFGSASNSFGGKSVAVMYRRVHALKSRAERAGKNRSRSRRTPSLTAQTILKAAPGTAAHS
jgi:hypothetical protein